MWPLPLAALVAAAGALGGWATRSLTPSGALAAWVVGTALLHPLGAPGLAILLAFFIPSSAISRVLRSPALPDAKGDRRDHWQVLANGGMAAAAACLAFRWPGLGLWAATTSLAAASADTWATAVGVWSGRPSHDIINGGPMPPGGSGGITLPGTLGGAAGAAIVAAAGGLAAREPALVAAAMALGFAWMLGDSILGAAAQARFHCPMCRVATERPVHRCGTPAAHAGGWRWLSNDGVNLCVTLGAALDGGLVWWWCCA
jgi:uncharacterized protein (TIGR00297 family)